MDYGVSGNDDVQRNYEDAIVARIAAEQQRRREAMRAHPAFQGRVEQADIGGNMATSQSAAHGGNNASGKDSSPRTRRTGRAVMDMEMDTRAVSVVPPVKLQQYADPYGVMDARRCVAFFTGDAHVEFVELSTQTNEHMWLLTDADPKMHNTVWVCKRVTTRGLNFSQPAVTWLLAGLLSIVVMMVLMFALPSGVVSSVLLVCGSTISAVALMVGVGTMKFTTTVRHPWVAMSRQRWDALFSRVWAKESNGVEFSEICAWLDTKVYG